MQFNTDTPRRDRAIADFLLSIPQPYVEGHVCTPGEAAALNQLIAENVSNNIRAKLKEGIPAPEGSPEGTAPTPHDTSTAQALVDTYLATYEMGVRKTGTGQSRVLDPIEREARKLAKAKAKDLVAAAGKKAKDVNLDEIADAVYQANIEPLHAAAKKLLAAASKAAEGIDTGNISI